MQIESGPEKSRTSGNYASHRPVTEGIHDEDLAGRIVECIDDSARRPGYKDMPNSHYPRKSEPAQNECQDHGSGLGGNHYFAPAMAIGHHATHGHQKKNGKLRSESQRA